MPTHVHAHELQTTNFCGPLSHFLADIEENNSSRIVFLLWNVCYLLSCMFEANGWGLFLQFKWMKEDTAKGQFTTEK